MSRLEDAIQAAEARKAAALGDDAFGLVATEGDMAERAIFSGFDIEHEELVATAHQRAAEFTHSAANVGLLPLFITAWCDGLLAGLMAGSLPPHDPELADGFGSGG